MEERYNRSSPVGKRMRSLLRPPRSEPWVWHTDELMASPAWQAQSLHCRRLIDFLEREHMDNAGVENGNLTAPYGQLVERGIGRRFISKAIREAEFLGLVRCEHGGRWAETNQPSRFALTYYPTRDLKDATDDWKNITWDDVRAWREAAKKQNRATERCTTVVHPW